MTAGKHGSLDETRHFYYTSQWQDIEERLEGETDPNQQYFWGIRYIDDLVCRNRTPTAAARSMNG